MTEEEIYLINYRIEKALTTLVEAKLMFKNNLLHGAVNRLYYACFYSVIALLLTKYLSAKTHKGVRNLFNLHFVETNLITKDISKFYSELFNARQRSDYEDFTTMKTETVSTWINQSENFISVIKELIITQII